MPPIKWYKTCVVCGVRSCRNENVRRRFMAKFPLDEDRCKMWVKNIGNKDLAYMPIQKLHQSKYVCGEHFKTKDFNKQRTRLKKRAIPSLKINKQPLLDDMLIRFPYHMCEQGNSSTAPLVSDHDQTKQQMYEVEMKISSLSDVLSAPTRSQGEGAHDQEMICNFSVPFVPDQTQPPMYEVEVEISSLSDVLSAPTRSQGEGAHDQEMICNFSVSSSSNAGDHNYCKSGFSKDAKNRNRPDGDEVTPRKKKLLKKIEKNKITLKTLQKRVQILDSIESPTLKTLIGSTIKNQKKKPQAKRWNSSDKGLALSIYKKSPKAYRYLRHLVPLPSVRTLQTVLSKMPLEPGINDVVMSYLKKKAEALTEEDKICVLAFDEMALKKRLILNTSTDTVVGFEDLAESGGRSSQIADHALVFLLQGVRKKHKQPVAYYFTKGTISTQNLVVILKTVIRKVTDQGYNILATVSDQGPTNVGAMTLLKKMNCIPVEENYFLINDKKIFILFDIPHLFKSLRNNFLKAGEIIWDGKRAKWSHLIELEEKNQQTLHFTKITKLAIEPKYKSKMKVKLAAQILSNTVAAVLKLLAESAEGQKKTDLKDTAEVIEDLDKLFDSTNGPASYKDVKKNVRENVKKDSFHHGKWIYYLKKLKSLKFVKNNGNYLTNVKCVKGYIISIQSLRDIWAYVEKKGFKYLNLRQLNQDSLENLFGMIRQHSPTNRHPTCYHFTCALKSSILTSLSTPALRGANCEPDNNSLMFNFHDLVFEHESQKENIPDTEPKPGPSRPLLQQEDFPVLSLVDDEDDQEENLFDFACQPAVYVSGFIAKKLLKNVKCENCQKTLSSTERDHGRYTFIRFKEWYDDPRLTYPSESLCNEVISLTKVFDEQVKPKLYVQGIINYSQTMMLGALNTLWMCPQHYSEISMQLAMTQSLLLIRNECRKQNQKISLAEEETADVIKKSEQRGIGK